VLVKLLELRQPIHAMNVAFSAEGAEAALPVDAFKLPMGAVKLA